MNKSTFQSLIAILFILSGATGLVYQIVWFKYLSLFLGNTTYAQTIVLATFMGGLSLGAALWGRTADRLKRPVMLYGILELVISFYCFFFPEINTVVRELFYSTAASMGLAIGSPSLLALKFAASALMLLVPTILMGGTLPILVKGITSRIEESGNTVALLYFLNSFGAVAGSLMGGFILVRLVGLEGSITSTAVLNAGIAFIALFLSLQHYELSGEKREEREEEPAQTFTPRQVRIAVAAAGVSGAASMMYEVTWVRMLTPVFGSSTYSFSLMLVAFISGITLGSLIVSKYIGRMKNVFGFLAAAQFGVVVSMLLSLPLYGRIPYLFWNAGTYLTRSDATYPLYLLFQFLFCFAVMFVPTVFLGMTLPAAARIAARSMHTLGRTVGNVFSVNTVGTVLGSLGAGLVLIPLIGLRHTVETALALNALTGVLVLWADGLRTRMRKLAMSGSVLAAAALYLLTAADWNQLMFYSGVFRMIVKEDVRPPKNYDEFLLRTTSKTDLYYKEGASATVGVVRAAAAGVEQNVLLINGKSDASSVGDLPTQILLAQLPMTLHPRPDTALIIGFGSGVTAGSVLTHDVKLADCVEISPEVVEASAHFNDVNNRPLEDPRLRLHIEDARAFLRLSPHRYDVIISEPSNPWIAGIGTLYSEEFFRECRGKLRPEGLMVQWFHLYEIDDAIFQLVLRTFQAHFPHVTVWHSLRNDVLLIGSLRPVHIGAEQLRGKTLNPRVSEDLARIGLNHLPSLLSLQSLSSASVREYADHGEVNSENRPLLEYNAPKAFFTSKGVPGYRFYDERTNIRSDALFLSAYAKKYPLASRDRFLIALTQSDAERGDPGIAYSLFLELRKEFPKDQLILQRLATLAGTLGRRQESAAHYAELSRMRPDDPYILSDYAFTRFLSERQSSSYLQHADFAAFERLFDRCIAMVKDTVDLFNIRSADMYFSIQEYAKAAARYERALELRQEGRGLSTEPLVELFLKTSRSYYFAGNLPKALEYGILAGVEDQENREIKDYLYKIMQKQLAN